MAKLLIQNPSTPDTIIDSVVSDSTTTPETRREIAASPNDAPIVRDSRQEMQVVSRYQEKLLEALLAQMKINNLILLQIAGLAGVPIRTEDFACELFQEGTI